MYVFFDHSMLKYNKILQTDILYNYLLQIIYTIILYIKNI